MQQKIIETQQYEALVQQEERKFLNSTPAERWEIINEALLDGLIDSVQARKLLDFPFQDQIDYRNKSSVN